MKDIMKNTIQKAIIVCILCGLSELGGVSPISKTILLWSFMASKGQCVPCEGNIEALSPAEIAQEMKSIPTWQLEVCNQSPCIKKTFPSKKERFSSRLF